MEAEFSLRMGRMLGASKSTYRTDHPTHVVVFNANLCTKEHGKLWYGDLDLDRDETALKEFQAKLGVPLFVLHEGDARFENERNPRFENYVAVFDKGEWRLNRSPRD